MKALKKLVAVAALSLPLATFAQEAPKPPDAPKITVTPYGIVSFAEYKNDGVFAAQDYPAYVTSEHEGALVMSAKQSRFGFNVGVPAELAGGVAVTGKIEADFMGGNSSSYTNANLRLRHAFVNTDIPLGPGKLSILFGQTDGLLNSIHPESTSYLANPLFQQAGNIHRRTAQLRLGYGYVDDTFGVKFEVAALNPTENTNAADLTYNTGNRSGMADFEGRLGLTLKPVAGFGGTVGASYHTHNRAYDGAGYATNPDDVEKVAASAFGIDLVADLTEYLGLRGEYFNGKGIDDAYAGIATVSVVGVAGAREAVKSDGYWAQAIIKPVPMFNLLVGLGQEKVGDYVSAATTAQRVENKMMHGGLLVNMSKAWRLGLEYVQTTTTTRANGTAAAAQTELKGSQLSLSTQLRF